MKVGGGDLNYGRRIYFFLHRKMYEMQCNDTQNNTLIHFSLVEN